MLALVLRRRQRGSHGVRVRGGSDTSGGPSMNPLLPISLRMLLLVSSALALASLAASTPTSAQSLYRCIGRDGQIVISKSTPDAPVPAGCQEAAAKKDLEAVK